VVVVRADVPFVGRCVRQSRSLCLGCEAKLQRALQRALAKVCFADGNSVCFASSKRELCHNEESVRNTCAARGLNI